MVINDRKKKKSGFVILRKIRKKRGKTTQNDFFLVNQSMNSFFFHFKIIEITKRSSQMTFFHEQQTVRLANLSTKFLSQLII